MGSSRRLDSIEDWAAGSETGTAVAPIQVGQFPYVHNGDTSTSLSDMYDACAASIDKKETGPEVIYEIQIPSPGKLTVSVQDGPGVDIDVHLYSALDTYHCVARHDSLIEAENLACGTWYVVADSWCNASGTEFPGPYTLTIEFQPYGDGCSTANDPYDFQGEAGDACAYAGNQNLPACNPNAGGQVCLYSDEPGNQSSFCSFMCNGDSDCANDFPGGCCVDIVGAGEPQDFFCVTESFCTPTPPPGEQGAGPVSMLLALLITLCMRDRLSHGHLPSDEPFECPVFAVAIGVGGLMNEGSQQALGERIVAMEEELQHVAG